MKSRQGCQVFYNVVKLLSYTSCTIAFLLSLTYPAYAGEVSYEAALELKKNGDHEKAESYFRELLKEEKDNAEYWFQLGLLQRFQAKRAEAKASQEKALALLPENHDIRLELARLHSWNQNYTLASSMVDEVLEAHPNYQDALDLAASIERATSASPDPRLFKWQLDFGYENSSFSRRPQPDWHHYFLQLGHWISEDTLVHLRTENVERQKAYNEHYEVGIAHIFNDIYNGHISIGYTPDSTFIPKWRIKTGGQARLIFDHEHLGNTWLTANVQHDRYTALETTVIKPGIRYQFFDNWQIHAQHINVIDENDKHLKGWAARLDWQTPLPEVRVFAGLGNAPETENAVTVNTKARFGGLSYQISPKVTVHASYAREDRENSFIRNIVSTAISVKF